MTDDADRNDRADPALRGGAKAALLLASGDTVFGFSVARRHVDLGWLVTPVADGAAAVAAAALGHFALIRLASDLPVIPPAIVAARIGRMPGGRGRVPVLIAAADDAVPSPLPLSWDPAPEPGDDPMARLVPLLGAAGARHLMQRFRGRVVALLDASDPYAIGEGDTVQALAHRMGGLAGTLGFGDLAAAWLAVESGAGAGIDMAWIETRIARAMLAMLLDPAIPPMGGWQATSRSP